MGLLRWLRGIFGRGAAPPTHLGVPETSGEDVVVLGPSDTLDLHTFHPRDVASVVLEFLDEAAREGIEQVRIIHGKGIGVQRSIVRGILEKHPAVVTFGDARDASGWGATVVRLRPRPADRNGG
jgi:dsDNA-specific endonuclease/ATPase MutS2